MTPLSKDEAKLSFLVSLAPTTSSHWPNSSAPLRRRKFTFYVFVVFGVCDGIFGIWYFELPQHPPTGPTAQILCEGINLHMMYLVFEMEYLVFVLGIWCFELPRHPPTGPIAYSSPNELTNTQYMHY